MSDSPEMHVVMTLGKDRLKHNVNDALRDDNRVMRVGKESIKQKEWNRKAERNSVKVKAS